MTIYLTEDGAFVDLNDGYLLYIVKRNEVEDATPEKVMRLFWEALAHARYNSISSAKGQSLQ